MKSQIELLFETTYVSYNYKMIYIYRGETYIKPKTNNLTNLTTNDIYLNNILTKIDGIVSLDIKDLTDLQIQQFILLLT